MLPSTAFDAEPEPAVLLCDADFITAMFPKMFNFVPLRRLLNLEREDSK